MLKGLAETFGGDRACTDCARVFRLPGFFNRKYTPAFPVTSEMHAIQSEYSPSDFRLELPTVTDGSTHHNQPAKTAWFADPIGERLEMGNGSA